MIGRGKMDRRAINKRLFSNFEFVEWNEGEKKRKRRDHQFEILA
jgi:hypothetical protein